MIKIILVAGARPNFMKIAPILREIKRYPQDIQSVLVHTGQHYDRNMSETFFGSLAIQSPDYNLEVGSASHAVQTANIMIRFEQVCLKEMPDMIIVVGDVNSTIAAGLVAKKLNVSLAHVEAGLRSGDRSMPEEINRIATDAIADLFFTTEEEATRNLLAEGHNPSSVHFVGHVMIDNLLYQLNKLSEFGNAIVEQKTRSIKCRLPSKYICMTLHRPSNVDQKPVLEHLLMAVAEIAKNTPVIFPCHPRTFQNIQKFGLSDLLRNIDDNDSGKTIDSGLIVSDPMDYNDFLYLWKDATVVLTDSGGLQEETTALKIPCITLRSTTERPITVEMGTNIVVGTDPEKIVFYCKEALEGRWKKGIIPPLWDGKAAERIIKVVLNPDYS